jgi:hypothetical protein
MGCKEVPEESPPTSVWEIFRIELFSRAIPGVISFSAHTRKGKAESRIKTAKKTKKDFKRAPDSGFIFHT